MKTYEPKKICGIHMGAAPCSVDLGDGSERGEYVNQDYILHTLGRPHRAVSLMYCYYPFDEGWPERVSVAFRDKEISFAWDYPYDDYFTYQGGIGGSLDKEPFCQMRDVRKHGQDVILTLTIDPHVTDEQLKAIGRDLRTFGRIQLRINHEATGNWFSFTKRSTYQEIADFFVRAHKIIKAEAPNVSTIICIGGIEHLDKTEMEMEAEFKETVKTADIWSVDKYMALHWGWPYDVAEEGGNSFGRYPVEETYEKTKRSFLRYKEINGGIEKPMVMSEFNADGDVTGPYDQVAMVKKFCTLLKNDPDKWFSGFTFYQFRDRGRLGLETEDPSNSNVGIAQPVLNAYRELIQEPFFSPEMTENTDIKLPVTLRWGGAEDADGIAMTLEMPVNPVFCEAYFEEEAASYNLMMELNGQWFYKAPGVKCIDFMEAFFKKPLTEATTLTLKLFAPPATGENDLSIGEDGLMNSYTTITKLPKIRLCFQPVVPEVVK